MGGALAEVGFTCRWILLVGLIWGSSSFSIGMLSLSDRGGRGLGQVEEGSVAPPPSPPNSSPFF